jgi:hypothetical protein
MNTLFHGLLAKKPASVAYSGGRPGDPSMKSALAVLLLCSTSAFAGDMSAKPMKLMGYVGDSKCAATHNTSAPDADCVTKCISGGAKPVFIDDDKKQVWAIDNPDAVKAVEGKPVTVMATADSSAMTVHITKVVKVGKAVTPASSMKM